MCSDHGNKPGSRTPRNPALFTLAKVDRTKGGFPQAVSPSGASSVFPGFHPGFNAAVKMEADSGSKSLLHFACALATVAPVTKTSNATACRHERGLNIAIIVIVAGA